MKKTKRRSLLALISLALSMSLLLVGCSSKSYSQNASATESPMAPAPMESPAETEMGFVSEDNALDLKSDLTTSSPLADKNVKLIWTADLSMETLDFDGCVSGLNQLVTDFGGYIESSYTQGGQRLSGYSNNRYASYTIRIPAQRLDEFLEQMGSIGNVTSRSKSSRNITLDYADNEARKETLQLEQERLMELLAQATELEDIITLESRLSEIHYQLDGYSSTLRRYDDLVDFSTVELSINEVKQITEVDAATIPERISAGFKDSLFQLKEFFGDFFVFITARSPILLAWAIVIVLLVLLVRWIVKKLSRKSRRLAPPTYAQLTVPQQVKAEDETKDKKDKKD